MTGKRILYVQHADVLGGSVVSLKELVRDALAEGYDCAVVCVNAKIAAIYTELGARTYVCTNLARINHNTVLVYGIGLIGFLRLGKALLKTFISWLQLISIVRAVKPHVVHLNSSTLILYTIYFYLLGIPRVYHVRENVVRGHFGIRRSIISWIASRFASATIYISEFEFKLLRTKPERSFVVYNYVHLNDFLASAHRAVGNGHTALRLITLGGIFRLKGGDVILESLRFVSRRDVELVVLGSEDPRVNATELSSTDGIEYSSKVLALLNDDRIGSRVHFAGKVHNPEAYLATADVLIFWAAAPHFPRPVFEAWLLKKQVIYYNPLFENDLLTAENVMVAEDGSPSTLGQLIDRAASKPAEAGEASRLYATAVDCFTERNFKKIEAIYKHIAWRDEIR